MADTEQWQLTIVLDIAAMSERAADIVTETIRERPNAVLTLPTGSTPLHLFDILAARSARKEIDFSRVELFTLDDYLGLSGTEPNSLTAWLKKSLLERVNLQPGHVHLVPAGAADPFAAARAYDRALSDRGGFDLAVLGVGENGHIAFNEPGSGVDSRARIVDLTPETVAQASAYWDNAYPVPTQAMTVGIANLLEAKRIVLLASGKSKAAALRRALEAPMSDDVPASFLRLAGSRLEVIADTNAASELTQARTA
jgi:glucosamine-6-phosphate deaminase